MVRMHNLKCDAHEQFKMKCACVGLNKVRMRSSKEDAHYASEIEMRIRKSK